MERLPRRNFRLFLLADYGLSVVTSDIVELDSIPVHIVEDGEAALSPVRLRGGISESFSEEVFPYLMNNLV
jgi:hypothetical protein